VTLVELPQRKGDPRVFIEPPDPDVLARLKRAHRALGDLSDDFADLPGLDELGAALIEILDELEARAEDLEDDELGDVEPLPLFAHAGLTR
jgi:hypothetical protein